ncbi:acetoacetate-CoA ligase [Colletotrichum lupini]|uniref:Acetoacetate-CoA ligase n=1 Tax=Colletotrichum lupini TaxID=145971 RepID=A0A9Q8ST07_9PEZI|nr:acetoacetate-CoA ligase [Colletotrichum lupini]UQC82271.1 acetoacetate-CoA ligase [Colletotrichum lupini]
MDTHEIPRKLWEHPDPKSTQMYQYLQSVNSKFNLQLKTFNDLHNWTVANRATFYGHLFDYANLIHEGRPTSVVDESLTIDAIPKWFPGVRLNWAENLLFTRGSSDAADHHGTEGKEDDKVAVTEIREGNRGDVRNLTWGELRRDAGRLAAALKARGVKEGDRVILVGANSIETLLVFVATTWLGGIFSSSSTDMGVKGILQRTTQVDPKFIFFDDATVYNGKTADLRDKMAEVVSGMGSCPSFSGLVSIPRFSKPYDVSSIPKTETWSKFLGSSTSAAPSFTRIPFHAPFLIYYSSGTTGIPKAIVHTVGGVMLNSFKEGRLHESMSPESVTLQYTTTGWIMYLANVAALLSGARVVMYDGSPFVPDLKSFIRILGEQRVTKLGISPRWMFEVAKNKISPREVTDLSSLKIVTSTGMVLSDQLFEWFYDAGFPKHVHLANISGGTDIAGCFGMENPLDPVYVGGTQGPSLGVPIAIYEAQLPDGPGEAVPNGTPGELVATAAFPNIPCFLWGDSAPPKLSPSSSNFASAAPGSKYHSAYFARFDNVWAHGDFCSIHPKTGNISFLGRADGVLNPSGVRFGSAEIYAVIERNFSIKVVDSLCVGQRRPTDNDESVMLFLMMREGEKFDRQLVAEVKDKIQKELTKRHVPKYIFQTPEIPVSPEVPCLRSTLTKQTTVNLKKVELPVKQIVSGRTIKPSGTLLNPQSLDFYYQFAKIEELLAGKEKL